MNTGEKILKINIDEEMKSAYIDYSMSVIVSRALPDVRDGLKPVHRRVLYGMQDLGVASNKPYKKSARIVGEVLGKYHPHGDSSVYEAMVRMAQHWSLRYPLVDGQGNFGSVDGDSPAAMRYTEARLRKIAEEMLEELGEETVDFTPNFDDSLQEPSVLPSKIPNLLINGASGIAVGMATNMAPHNLGEVIDATVAYIQDKEISIDGLMQYVKAPDFPTGGIIYGYEGVKQALETGRGRIVMRAKSDIETLSGGREQIIVTEIPYQVNKAEMIKKTADLVNDKKIEGISEIRDESDRNGMRIVYEIKRDATSSVVLNNLYKYTALQTSFSVNNIALVAGKPETLNLRQMIHYFVEHRHEIVIRRTKYRLRKAEERAHILEGLIIASDNIDEVIKIIRASQSPDEAKTALQNRFGLSEIQSRAIVEMRLRQLTGLEQDKLREEFAELQKTINFLNSILASEELRMDIIKNELLEIKQKYADARRTEIVYAAGEMSIEDLIPDEKSVVTISVLGYIKRTKLEEYRLQGRGGVGSIGSKTRDEDSIEQLFMATSHEYLLIFTEKGRCYWMRVYEIPEGSKTSQGRAIQNLIQLDPNDKIRAYVNVKNIKDPEYIEQNYIVLCTKNGIIKKTSLEAYSRPRQNGITALTVRENDQLLEAKLTSGKSEILLAVKSGKTIRFPEEKVRPMGRNASGVIGVQLQDEQDYVVGMVCADDVKTNVLVLSEKGYGKRSALEEYRITNRGGKGVKSMNVTEKTGALVAMKIVGDEHDIMIITKNGVTIRMSAQDLRVMGRNTQGVRLINLRANDEIAALAVVEAQEETPISAEHEEPKPDQEPNV
jgi:DNA gyrase subunit A